MPFLKRLAPFSILLLISCQPPLERQPKTTPFSAITTFENESSARPLPLGTQAFYKESEVPPPLNAELLQQGQQKFEIQCAACHGYAGHGDGLVTQRGYPQPRAFSELSISDTGIEQVIAGGKNPMPAFAAKLSPHERWAVVHYVRVLQWRERLPANLLSAEDKAQLEKSSP